jgi:hypothetical protein
MATGQAGGFGQRYHTNQTHFLAKTVSFADFSPVATVVVGRLPARAIVLRGSTWIHTGFDDTNGDDLDVGVEGGDDDLFASGVDLNTGSVLTAFDDLADANRYSATERTVTCTFTTAATGNGTAGEATVMLEYIIAPVVGP